MGVVNAASVLGAAIRLAECAPICASTHERRAHPSYVSPVIPVRGALRKPRPVQSNPLQHSHERPSGARQGPGSSCCIRHRMAYTRAFWVDKSTFYHIGRARGGVWRTEALCECAPLERRVFLSARAPAHRSRRCKAASCHVRWARIVRDGFSAAAASSSRCCPPCARRQHAALRKEKRAPEASRFRSAHKVCTCPAKRGPQSDGCGCSWRGSGLRPSP